MKKFFSMILQWILKLFGIDQTEPETEQPLMSSSSSSTSSSTSSSSSSTSASGI